MIPYYRWEIANHQINVQKTAVLKQIEFVKENLQVESTSSTWQLLDGLREQLTYIKEAAKDIEKIPHRRKRWWDWFLLKLYYWSVKDRFQF